MIASLLVSAVNRTSAIIMTVSIRYKEMELYTCTGVHNESALKESNALSLWTPDMYLWLFNWVEVRTYVVPWLRLIALLNG